MNNETTKKWKCKRYTGPSDSITLSCSIGFHKFGHWSEPRDGIALRVQCRTCTKCGFEDERVCGIVTK